MDDKRCATCINAKNITLMGDCICKYAGVVSGNDICDKYQLNMFDIARHLKRRKKEYTAEDFIIE